MARERKKFLVSAHPSLLDALRARGDQMYCTHGDLVAIGLKLLDSEILLRGKPEGPDGWKMLRDELLAGTIHEKRI